MRTYQDWLAQMMRQWRLATEWDSERGDAISIRDHTGTHRGPVIWGPRKHPVVDLMDYGGEGTQVFAAHPVNGDEDHDDDDDSDSGDDPDDADSDTDDDIICKRCYHYYIAHTGDPY